MMFKWKSILGALLALLSVTTSNPAAARWLSVDPVQANPNTGADFNRYRYANNNPYKFIDPDGRQSESVMDQRYVYSGLNPEQVAGINAQHNEIGAQATAGMAAGSLGGATVPGLLRAIVGAVVKEAASPKITTRPDVTLSGGRSGEKVKTLEGPPNSAVKGGKDRVFVTNDKGQVVKDITKDRVKDVTPGKGFGDKREPTKVETKLIDDVWKK